VLVGKKIDIVILGRSEIEDEFHYVILTNVYLIPTFYIASFMITILLLNNSFNELQIITVKYLLLKETAFSR
jgi:hypothetical protein